MTSMKISSVFTAVLLAVTWPIASFSSGEMFSGDLFQGYFVSIFVLLGAFHLIPWTIVLYVYSRTSRNEKVSRIRRVISAIITSVCFVLTTLAGILFLFGFF
jgi:hypothetical protein